MPHTETSFSDTVIQVLLEGGIAVIRTDTLYGVVAKVDNQTAVEKVYSVKQRTPTKSPIVLISSTSQLFDIYDRQTEELLRQYWPGPNSIILPSTAAPEWITRGNASVAYRLPADDALMTLIHHTGPLIAPSANPEGQPPASTIQQAIAYFGSNVDLYVDGGTVVNASPSKLFKLKDGSSLDRLR